MIDVSAPRAKMAISVRLEKSSIAVPCANRPCHVQARYKGTIDEFLPTLRLVGGRVERVRVSAEKPVGRIMG
jgi:hypothetical protein